MPEQILFLPDSELIVPGRSGRQPVLPRVRAAATRALAAAVAETASGEIAVAYTRESRFGRPLPGFEIASQLLRAIGFTGKLGPACLNDGQPRAPLLLVMGTGAASHGEAAPLNADARGSNIDGQIDAALREAHWEKLAEIKTGGAADVGATLVTAAATHSPAPGTYACTEFLCEQDYGVTYFVARWVRQQG